MIRRRPGRAFVEDRWHTEKGGDKVRTNRYGRGLRWRARWVDDKGAERSQSFARKIEADEKLKAVTADLVRGDYLDAADARTTVGEWCDRWLKGYAGMRPSTVRSARTHIALIKAEFGSAPLSSVRPSDVKRWTVKMRSQGRSQSYVYAVYRRFAQIMGDAAHDGLVRRSPCSRKVAPPQGAQRAYVATTEQIWGLYEAFAEHLRPAVLLGAFVGLRVAEAAALRVEDVDFMRGVVSPTIQYPAEPLKTEESRTPVPIPRELALMLSANVSTFGAVTVVTSEIGRQSSPWAIEREIRRVRSAHTEPLPKGHRTDCPGCLVPGLPADFRFHDLRHYLASLLISQGLDVKVVQRRMRHRNATTTLDVYGHLWPDADESAQAAITSVLAARAAQLRPEKSS